MNTIEKIGLIIIGFIWFIIFILLAVDCGKQSVKKDIKQWAIEYEYAHYHPKTGELEITNEKVKNLLEEE